MWFCLEFLWYLVGFQNLYSRILGLYKFCLCLSFGFAQKFFGVCLDFWIFSKFWVFLNFGSVQLLGLFTISLVFGGSLIFFLEFRVCTNFGSVRLLGLFQNFFGVLFPFLNFFPPILCSYKLWLCSTFGLVQNFCNVRLGFVIFFLEF